MKVASILMVVTLLGSGSSWAEIYKYTDENGQVTFTTVLKPGAERIELPKLLDMPHRKATSSEMKSCFNEHRSTFLDPRSAYPVSAKYYPNKSGYKNIFGDLVTGAYVEVDVSARNKMGGASRTMVRCDVK